LNRLDFQKLTQRRPEITLNIITVLSRRLRQANAVIENFAFQDARGRVIHAVAKLGLNYGKPSPEGLRVGLRVTHQELASLAGTSRETATRVLLEMQNEGLVNFKQRHLVIRDDLETLKKLAKGVE
jgi:CRP/FNR family transcriptional regulator